MYELKKMGKVFTSKFVGTGPSSYKKRIYRAAVSQSWETLPYGIIICDVSVSTMFTTLFYRRHDFRKYIIEYNVCVLMLSTNLPEIFLILRRIQWSTVIKVSTSSCKVPVILVVF
jgi:DNA mismatch repair ATPase MutS